jgi:hypothetical protein
VPTEIGIALVLSIWRGADRTAGMIGLSAALGCMSQRCVKPLAALLARIIIFIIVLSVFCRVS